MRLTECNIRSVRRLWIAVPLLACASCDSPNDRPTPRVDSGDVSDVGGADASVDVGGDAAVRTMKTAAIFGPTSMENLVMDPKFQTVETGIGVWRAIFSSSSSETTPPAMTQSTRSDSPAGIGLPVIEVYDNPDKGSPRSMSLTASVVGGVGPFSVQIWISSDAPLGGDAGTSAIDTSLVRVLFATSSAAATASATATDIPRDPASDRTIGGRAWSRFAGEVATTHPLGAFMIVRLKASKVRWWLQAPEILAKGLSGTVDTKMRSIRGPRLTPRPMDLEERAIVADYVRQPLRFGPKPHSP